MSPQNNLVFKILTLIAWGIFIALCIEAGALLFNFIYSLFNPIAVKNLYQNLDLSDMYNRSKPVYFFIYSLVLVVAAVKSFLFYGVIKLVSKLDLDRPFSNVVSKQITRISYITLSIGILSFWARQSAKNLAHRGYSISQLDKFWVDSQAYMLMAAVIYVIAVIFKRGIELQIENDSTI
ncbi:MAG: DUF2975 domain-containing protein [Chitinophagia bacterium]|jgi:Protein of unknown function (DUF2975)|nr:DUF2975 domain-containing protein [Chitinophagia bacterium]